MSALSRESRPSLGGPAGPAGGPAWVALFAGLALVAPAVVAGCRQASAPASAPKPLLLHRAAPVSADARGEFLGSEACVRCHAAEAQQLDTHHALTLRPLDPTDHERFHQGGRRSDSASGGVFEVARTGAKCVLIAKHGQRQYSVTAEHAFGSGNRGVTYLGAHEGRRVELRLSYYRPVRRWDFSPNQQAGTATETPVGRVVSGRDEETCFACHSTAVVREGGRLLPERSLLGIGCEGCHGAGREHVEAVRLNAPDLKMARLGSDPARVSAELCGQCHSAPDGKDPADPAVRTQLSRFQSQALTLSRCFIESQGRLTCMTCHDPHRDTTGAGSGGYEAVCLSCHTTGAAGQTPCPVEPVSGCVGCHMPSQTLPIATRPTYRMHWIGIWDKGALAPD